MPRPSPSHSTHLPPELVLLLPYYALVLAVLVFYSNIYDNAFLYDDKYLILNNRYLRSWASLGEIFRTYVNSGAGSYGRFYRPFQNVLYLIIYQTSGLRLFAFHILNVALHASNACLVYRLGQKLSFTRQGSFWAALIWALHPVQTEAVTYMSATADSLFVLFCLLGLLALLPRPTRAKICAAALWMVAALLSKESAIIFPVLALIVHFAAASDRRTFIRNGVACLPLFAIAAAYLMARYAFLPFGSTDLLAHDPTSLVYSQHILIRFYTFLSTVPLYVGLLIYPHNLHMDRGVPTFLDPWHGEVALGMALLVCAVLALTQASKPRYRPLASGLLWYAGAQIPQTGLFVPVNALFLEHWLYLPSIGLCLGLFETLVRVTASLPVASRMLGPVSSLLALSLGLLTLQQNKNWHDPLHFYQNILAQGESSYRVHNNLGITYLDRGDYAHALEQFTYNVDHMDLSPEAHQNIAAVWSLQYKDRQHLDAEIEELNRALAIDPGFIPAYVGLAELYASRGDTQASVAAAQHAARLREGLRP